MENAITDVRSQEQAHTKKAQQLALHWEAEAQRQAAIAQAGDVVHLQDQVEGLKNELSQLETALVDCEAQVKVLFEAIFGDHCCHVVLINA